MLENYFVMQVQTLLSGEWKMKNVVCDYRSNQIDALYSPVTKMSLAMQLSKIVDSFVCPVGGVNML